MFVVDKVADIVLWLISEHIKKLQSTVSLLAFLIVVRRSSMYTRSFSAFHTSWRNFYDMTKPLPSLAVLSMSLPMEHTENGTRARSQ
jgi:ABC-type proline/glycine betaine transport system permease subunit